ncbi:MAG TPA: hypothetical protein VGM37_01795 [Armatimonadota bacterium]|jgi:alpha-galactosidase
MPVNPLAAASLMALAVCAASAAAPVGDGFMNINRAPDAVTAITEDSTLELARDGDAWKGGGIEVAARAAKDGLRVELSAPTSAVKYLRLHWNAAPPAGWKYLGDAWERAYGNLQWLPLDAARVMPWYFLATDGRTTHGYGVAVGPAAMCGWTVDPEGVTLDADVRCGGLGVKLGNRRLTVFTILVRRGKAGETPFAAARAFCRRMSPKPRAPKQPIYGFNDWYCDYGKNSAQSVRYYAAFVGRLAPKGANRPFMVVDDGWQPNGGSGRGGPWDRANEKFGNMAEVAKDIRAAGARPGIWTRLLAAQDGQPSSWRIAGKDDVLDVSVPAVRAYVVETVARFRSWGYDLIKHDYSTWDISGAWGRSAGAAPDATWAFADRGRTTAEILRDHYQSIREGAGDGIVIGCNTVGHLAAGIFEAQRIGDDTSGNDWGRTLKMGVNALAFRAPQQGSFYDADADCVGLTQSEAIPWSLNRQWLDLVSRSGTPLFISFKQGSVTPEQEAVIASALAIAAKPHPVAEPLDWLESLQPRRWKLMGKTVEYDWSVPGK